MARIAKGILGGVSGKVGNVVGGSWKGRDYLRSLPAGGSNTNSEMQKAQRAKFKTLIAFLRPMTPLIRVGFKAEAEKITAFNAAVKYNYHHALDGDHENGYFVDYSLALLAKGELPPLSQGQLQAQEGQKLVLNWLNNTGYAGAKNVRHTVCSRVQPRQGQCHYQHECGTTRTGKTPKWCCHPSTLATRYRCLPVFWPKQYCKVQPHAPPLPTAVTWEQPL